MHEAAASLQARLLYVANPSAARPRTLPAAAFFYLSHRAPIPGPLAQPLRAFRMR